MLIGNLFSFSMCPMLFPCPCWSSEHCLCVSAFHVNGCLFPSYELWHETHTCTYTYMTPNTRSGPVDSNAAIHYTCSCIKHRAQSSTGALKVQQHADEQSHKCKDTELDHKHIFSHAYIQTHKHTQAPYYLLSIHPYSTVYISINVPLCAFNV